MQKEGYENEEIPSLVNILNKSFDSAPLKDERYDIFIGCLKDMDITVNQLRLAVFKILISTNKKDIITPEFILELCREITY